MCLARYLKASWSRLRFANLLPTNHDGVTYFYGLTPGEYQVVEIYRAPRLAGDSRISVLVEQGNEGHFQDRWRMTASLVK